MVLFHSVYLPEYSQVDCIILRATCHVSLHMTRVSTLLLLVLEWLNGFGPDRFCSVRTDNSNIMLSIAICVVPRGAYLWHVARDLTTLFTAAERMIRF